MDDEEKEGALDDEILEPLEEGAINDFRFDAEDEDNDPDGKFH